MEESQENQEATLRTRFGRLYSAKDVSNGLILPPPPLFDNFLLSKTITMVSAERGTGKTWLLLEMLLCLERGTPFLSKYPPSKKFNRVLFCGMDSSPWDIGKQFMKLCRGRGMSAAEQNHLSSDFLLRPRTGKRFNIMDPNTLDWLHDWIQATKTNVIMLDSLRSIHLGNENDSLQMELLTESLRRLRDKSDVSVIFTHHLRKSPVGMDILDSGNDSARGSGAITDALDFHIQLRKSSKGQITLSMPKGREDFDNWADLVYTRTQVPTSKGPGIVLTPCDPLAIYTPLLAAIAAGANTRAQLIAAIPGPKSNFFVDNGLRKLEASGQITKASRGTWQITPIAGGPDK